MAARHKTGVCSQCGKPSSFTTCYACMQEEHRLTSAPLAAPRQVEMDLGEHRRVCGKADPADARHLCSLDLEHEGVFHETHRAGMLVARWPRVQ